MTKKTALNIINWTLYVTVAVVPLIFMQKMMNPFIIPKITLFQSLVEIIIFLWIGLAIFHKKYRPKFTPLTTSLLVLFSILTISSVFGVDLRLSLWSTEARGVGIVALWHFFLLFLSLVSLRKEIKWKNIFIVSTGISALVSIAALLAFSGSFLESFFLNQGGARPGATFGNPTFLAGYLLFNVFLAFWLLKEKLKNKWIRFLPILTVIFGIAAIFRTQTRGDIIGLVAGLVFLSLLLAIRRFKNFSKQDGAGSRDFSKSVFKNVWLWVLVVIFIFGGTFFFTRHLSFWNNVPGLERLTTTSLVRGDLDYRFMAWESGFQGFLERPVLGYGWENFNTAFSRHYNPNLLGTTFNETNWDKPHNALIEYLVTGGILGFLAYLAVFVALFYEIFKSKGSFYKKTIFGSLVVAYFIQNLVIFDTIGTYLMFFIISAFITSKFLDSKQKKTEETEQEEIISTKKHYSGVLAFLLVLSFIPIYFLNVRTAVAVHYEYGGPNYFLNRDILNSFTSFQKALDIPSPYRDFMVMNFIGVVRQAYQQGIEYPNLKNLQKELVSEMEKVIKRHPQNYFYYSILADFKNNLFKFNPNYLDDAEELARKALELSPNRQQIYYVLAKTNILRGEYNKAKEMFQRAVDLNPNAGDPHFYVGLLAYQTGDTKTGDREISIAGKLGRTPKNISEAVALGTILGDLEKRYDKSIEYYKLALDMSRTQQSYLSPQDIELKLALSYYFNNQLDKSRETFKLLKNQGVDFKTSPSYEDLKPLFNSLGLDY